MGWTCAAPDCKGHFEADCEDALGEFAGAGAEVVRGFGGESGGEGGVEGGGRPVAAHIEALHRGGRRERGSGVLAGASLATLSLQETLCNGEMMKCEL